MSSHREHHLPCLNQSAASFVGFRFGCCITSKHPARSPDQTFGTRWNKLSILWFGPSSIMSQIYKRKLKPVTQFFESKSRCKMGTQHPNSWWFQQKVHGTHSLKHTEFLYCTIFVNALMVYSSPVIQLLTGNTSELLRNRSCSKEKSMWWIHSNTIR